MASNALTEAEWYALPRDERARKAAFHLARNAMDTIAHFDAAEEAKAEAKKNAKKNASKRRR